MKLKDGFILRTVADTHIVVAVGKNSESFNKMIKLNDSTIRVLRLNDIDSIESFTDKKSNSVVPALLSALGIRVGDE